MELGVKTEVLILSACKLLSLWVEKSKKFPKHVGQIGKIVNYSKSIVDNNHQHVYQIISKVARWNGKKTLKFLNSTAYNSVYISLR